MGVEYYELLADAIEDGEVIEVSIKHIPTGKRVVTGLRDVNVSISDNPYLGTFATISAPGELNRYAYLDRHLSVALSRGRSMYIMVNHPDQFVESLNMQQEEGQRQYELLKNPPIMHNFRVGRPSIFEEKDMADYIPTGVLRNLYHLRVMQGEKPMGVAVHILTMAASKGDD